MGFVNNYKYENYSNVFSCQEGDRTITIRKVELKTTKTNRQMIEVSYDVETSNGVLYVDRLVESEFFNKSMSRFFDAFNIPVGNFNYRDWIGKQAKANFKQKEETYIDANGQERTIQKMSLEFLYGFPQNQQNVIY